jgi:hypothetical protein
LLKTIETIVLDVDETNIVALASARVEIAQENQFNVLNMAKDVENYKK